MSSNATCDFEISFENFVIFQNLINKLQNSSVFANRSKIDAITQACAQIAWTDFTNTLNSIQGLIGLTLSIFGFFGAVLTLVTICKNKQFEALCYSIFCVVAVIEIFYLPIIFLYSYKILYNVKTSRSFIYVWIYVKLAGPIGNIFAFTVQSLAIFLSIERTIATLVPSQFYLIDRKNVLKTIFSIIVLLALIIFIPKIFESDIELDKEIGIYTTVLTELGKKESYKKWTKVCESFILARAITLIVSTILSVIGMVRARSKRSRLIDPSSQYNSNNAHKVNKLFNMIQLCYLVICSAIPNAVNQILYAISTEYPILYPNDIMDIQSAYRNSILGFCRGVSNMITHTMDFYLYLIFSSVMRREFKNRIWNKF